MLDRDRLQRNLLRIFASPSTVRTAEDAERQWSDAYTAYASSAEDMSGDALASSNPIGFRQALSFRTSRTPSTFAQQIESAFQAYWRGATFSIGTPPAGSGAPCPNVGGNGIFSSELTSIVTLVSPRAMYAAVYPVLTGFGKRTSAAQKAAQLALAMHGVTTSAITVLITGLDTTPPMAGPLPITNICTVF